MRRATTLWTTLCITALAGMLAAEAQLEPLPANDQTVLAPTAPEGEPLGDCPLVTIAKGLHSGCGADRPRFAGADFLIRDPDAWVAFWRVHAGEFADPPPVDFEHRVVIATIMGPQPTTGGPNIAIVRLQSDGPFAKFVIIDDKRPGPDEGVSNPFHIVSVCRERVPGWCSVSFLHRRPLPESGSVIGRVFAVPPEGEPTPLFGALVTLLRADGEPRHALTGRDGSYFFVNVEPGECLLRAGHPGFEPAEVGIEIPPNTLVHHPFFLTPLPPPPPGRIVGLVLGMVPEGEPVPLVEALVQLLRDDDELARRFTNDDGHFVFVEVPPGEYLLRASHEGFFPQMMPVVVEPDGVVEQVFILEPVPNDQPGAFVGRVLGVIDDGHQVPIPGALVRLLGPDGEVVGQTHTNLYGHFAIYPVPPGVYAAIAHAPEWLPDETEVEIHPGEPTHHVFLLQRP